VRRVVVLLSGGQDSTTSLYWARRAYPDAELHALTLFYGQRHSVEIEAAGVIAKMAGCASHMVVNCPILGNADSALVDASKPLKASGGFADSAMPEGLPTSFVPGRNLVFLALAAAHAGTLHADVVVTGVCQTDYSGYPDCRAGFIASMNDVILAAWPSGDRAPLIKTPLMTLTKAETVALANELPGCMEALQYSVTCYYGHRPGCMKCPACELRHKGFIEAGVCDPAVLAAS
jgi:7-cyano-7-deazaguanine synthase